MDAMLLVRIDRVLEKVRTLRDATKEEASEDSVQRYHNAYLALGGEMATVELVVVELKDNGYPDPNAIDPALKTDLTVKPSGDRADLLLHGLDGWEKALMTARGFVVDRLQQDGPWSRADMPSQWGRRYGFSSDTFIRRCESGQIRHKKHNSKSYSVHVDDLPASTKPDATGSK